MIKLKNIQHSFGGDFSLDIKSLSLDSGSTTYIVGASGSGKSTLLRIMAGLDSFDSGEIFIDNLNIKELAKKNTLHQLNMMFMTQELGLWPHMSTKEHILFVLDTKDIDEVDVWLKKVQLHNMRELKPYQLSGGQRQRLALAISLCVQPKYLFLDEPFASLDLVLADELYEIIAKEQKEQKFTLVQISHHSLGLENKEAIILVMSDGTIIQQGSLEEIIANPIGNWSEKWALLLSKKL